MKTDKVILNLTLITLVVIIILFTSSRPCSPEESPKIPESLTPWIDWVLHDQKEQLQCIPFYNDPQRLQCNWPTELKLDLDEKGGTFKQIWRIQHETWISLPGNDRQWPKDVAINGQPTIVLHKNNAPKVLLTPGTHEISGGFTWFQLPEYLKIPIQSALVSLSVNAGIIDFPNIDDSGRLWLKTAQKEEKIEDRLKVECFRLINDTIPQSIEFNITLDVSGSAREIVLGPLYIPSKFIPLELSSPLPARLEQDARMRVQVRPGRHNFSLILRPIDPLHQLSFDNPNDEFWPQQEIWSFAAHTNLRIVEIEGVPAIDPLQTSVPPKWQKYPAYRILPGETMQFKEFKRGDPHPAPDQLTLTRTLWLRFDGSGYAIQDDIKGQKNTNWRLEMNPAIKLGRVAVDGTEAFITQRDGSDKAGVELRKGVLNLTAESHFQRNNSTLPATGWDHDFQQIQGRLQLPPGWKLISASGIDNIPRTWLNRWTLLDFFILLIFTIAVSRLFSKTLAGTAFITLALIYHEPGAPRYVWLALLIGFALIKHLPQGKFKRVVTIYQVIVALLLIFIAIPYSIDALRVGVFPQLAKPWISMTDHALMTPQVSEGFGEYEADEEEEFLLEDAVVTAAKIDEKLKKRRPRAPTKSWESDIQSSYLRRQVMQVDPNAITQTGPGLPQWQPFETINFSWSGPVTSDQKISFRLIGPRTNLILSFIRVFLIILLFLGMFGIRYRPGTGFQFPRMKSLFTVLFLTLILSHSGLCQANEFPPQEMLNELQQRLLEKDKCFPACADISDLQIFINPKILRIVMNVDAQIDTAIPLPSHVNHWLPQKVVVDDEDAEGLFRSDNNLWVMMPTGKHTIKATGAIRKQNTLQLPFPLKPHGIRIKAVGWSVEGVHSDGTFDSQVHFRRILNQDERQSEILETGVLPPFAQVRRNVFLGLFWQIETVIQRVSPTGSAMVLNIPLLPGESVTTDGIRVTDGVAHVNMRADQKNIRWESFLEPSETIVLHHTETHDWTEVWQVDVSPMFHMESDGIPVILHKTGNQWSPTWRPWPGETVTLKISRPKGIEGQTMTIENSHLELQPGQRTTHAKLRLEIKSSQGGQHSIVLPPKAELQEVKLAGKIQPVRQEGRNVPLPITPGKQSIELQWRESEGFKAYYETSDIDLDLQSVNASVDVSLPRNRWPLLMGGEQLVGPAILYWSVLLIIVIVAFGLSRTGLTPLKFHHWFLLGVGMSMSNLAASFMVVAWLIALDLKKKVTDPDKPFFNLIQVGIGILTLFAVGSIVFSISLGLIGHPDMSIMGNGSNGSLLRWYHDLSDHSLPHAWVFSIPMLAYRLAMLAWALWISFWLIGVLKWGWEQFSAPTIWRSSKPKPDTPPKIPEAG